MDDGSAGGVAYELNVLRLHSRVEEMLDSQDGLVYLGGEWLVGDKGCMFTFYETLN